MKRYVAVVAVAAMTAVAGFGVGQISEAESASAYTERQIVRELRQIKKELEAIKYNTGAVCQDSSSGYSCKKF